MVRNLNLPNMLGWLFPVFCAGRWNTEPVSRPRPLSWDSLHSDFCRQYTQVQLDAQKRFGFGISYYLQAGLAIILHWVTLAVDAIAEGYYP